MTMNKASRGDEIPSELFKILMLLKRYTQYVSKFGNVSSGHKTRKHQFSFESQRRTMPKNVQTIVHLHSFHTPARLYSTSFQLGFSVTWTENFQVCKWSFKEAEKPEIKLPTFAGSWRKQGSSRKTLISASLTMLKPLTMWIATNWKNLQEMGIPDHLTCLLRNLYVGQEATIRIRHGTSDWFQIGEGVWQDCILSSCLFNLYVEYITWNARLDESQLESRLQREISTVTDMQMIPL